MFSLRNRLENGSMLCLENVSMLKSFQRCRCAATVSMTFPCRNRLKDVSVPQPSEGSFRATTVSRKFPCRNRRRDVPVPPPSQGWFPNATNVSERSPCRSHLKEVVPADSPSRGGDGTVYVLDVKQPSLPTLFTLFLCLFLSLWSYQIYFIP